jgi:hypothetical protein
MDRPCKLLVPVVSLCAITGTGAVFIAVAAVFHVTVTAMWFVTPCGLDVSFQNVSPVITR